MRSDDDGKINSTTRVYRTWKYEPKLYEHLELRKIQHEVRSHRDTEQSRRAEADEGVLVSDFNDARGTPKKAPPRVSPPPRKEPAAQRVVH